MAHQAKRPAFKAKSHHTSRNNWPWSPKVVGDYCKNDAENGFCHSDDSLELASLSLIVCNFDAKWTSVAFQPQPEKTMLTKKSALHDWGLGHPTSEPPRAAEVIAKSEGNLEWGEWGKRWVTVIISCNLKTSCSSEDCSSFDQRLL